MLAAARGRQSAVRRWPRLTPDIRTALALLGLVAYAVLRIAYSVFYNRFGLSPDDLGLSYVDLLVQSAVGTSVLLLLVVAGASILFAELVGVVAIWGDLRRTFKSDSEPPPGGAVTVLLSLVVLGSVVAGAIGLHALAGILLTIGTLTLAGWATIRGGIIIVHGVSSKDSGRVAHTRWWRRFVAAAVMLAVAIAIAGLIAQASSDASHVYEGRPASFTVLGVRVTSWGAERATVSWTSNQVAPDLQPLAGRCLMYLGQSGATNFLYRPDTHEVVRIPMAVSTVHIRPPTCIG
jgi:hypothetical protein